MEIIEKEVLREPKKEYASKGVAGAGLGLGIAGTALGLLNSNGLFGYGNRRGGYGMPQNVNINTDTASVSGGAPSAFMAWEKSCDEDMAMQKEFCNWALVQQNQRFTDRQTIDSEMFGLYKSQVDADFSLYKSGRDANDAIVAKHNADSFALYKNQRDNFDVLSERISKIECKQAIDAAVEPWRDTVLNMRLNLEAERRCCADNKIVNYVNRTFYPVSVTNVALGTTSTPRTLYNPLCGCCGDGFHGDMK